VAAAERAAAAAREREAAARDREAAAGVREASVEGGCLRTSAAAWQGHQLPLGAGTVWQHAKARLPFQNAQLCTAPPLIAVPAYIPVLCSRCAERERQLQRAAQELDGRASAVERREAAAEVARREAAAAGAELAQRREELELLERRLQEREEVRPRGCRALQPRLACRPNCAAMAGLPPGQGSSPLRQHKCLLWGGWFLEHVVRLSMLCVPRQCPLFRSCSRFAPQRRT
jgi:DNA repair exonuclease SbcCD ATPase subunit